MPPASLRAVAERVAGYPLGGLANAMILAGLTDPGPPINVLLVAEGSELARNTPSWISGFADAGRSLVVLFPERHPAGIPTDSLEALLQHEVAHVLISRAARGRPVPRWFNEGLALAAERPVGFEDRSRVAWTRIRHGEIPAGRARASVYRGAGGQSAGLRRRRRPRPRPVAAPRRRRRRPDTRAPRRGAALPPRVRGGDGRAARRRRGPLLAAPAGLWIRWIAFAGRPLFQWMVITLLALCAIYAHRRRRAEQRRRWEEEEALAVAEDLLRQRLRDADPRAPGSAYDKH